MEVLAALTDYLQICFRCIFLPTHGARLHFTLSPLSEEFAIFKDILIADSTLIRLHDLLEKAFPSVWANYMKASIKAHVVLSVRGGGAYP